MRQVALGPAAMNSEPWFAGLVAFFVVGFLVVERSPAGAVLVGLVAGVGAYLWARRRRRVTGGGR